MRKRLVWILPFLVAAAVLAYPSFAAQGGAEGLRLCGQVVIPSLFPYMVLSSWLVNRNVFGGLGRALRKPLGFIFNMPPTAIAPLLIGWLCGYPTGVRAAAKEYEEGRLTKGQTERLMTFCACVSPQFSIAALGSSLMKSSYAGVCIYLGSLLSCITVGIAGGLVSRRWGREQEVTETKRSEGGFFEAVADGSEGMLRICALTVFFAALTGIAEGSGLLKRLSFLLSAKSTVYGDGFWRAALKSFIELTGGAAEAAGVTGGFLICAAGAGFGGVCVISQCIALSRTARKRLRVMPTLLSRVIHGVLTAVFSSLLLGLDRSATAVFSAGAQSGGVSLAVDNIPAATVMLVLSAAVLLRAAAVTEQGKRKGKERR